MWRMRHRIGTISVASAISKQFPFSTENGTQNISLSERIHGILDNPVLKISGRNSF